MGFFRSLSNGFSKAFHWLTMDKEKSQAAKGRDYVEPDEVEDGQDELRKKYDPWEEVDSFRMNFFLGGWASRKLKKLDSGELTRGREEFKRKRAEAEGREYKSALERDLEAVAKKREEKERRKEEKRRQKGARKQKS